MQKMLAQNRILILIATFVLSVLAAACGSEPIKPRSVMPADSLFYLETADLGKALTAITEQPKYHEMAKTVPDLSPFHGVEVSVAITGFETSEDKVSAEGSVLNFTPKFVAAAETHYWNFQVVSFAERELSEFVNEMYDGETVLETSEKHGGKFYTWTAKDGERRTYALVIGSLLLFGNDSTAIEKCIAVKNGQADGIAKTGKITDGERLAFGYAAPDGVAQAANIAGISLAMNAADDGSAQSFIARVLPEIIRNSVKEIAWTATAGDAGIEDTFIAATDPESAAVFNETLSRGGQNTAEPVAEIMAEKAVSVTRYDLKDPRIAWRSVLLTARSKVDDTSGAVLAAFSGSLFEPYGIADPELFLSSANSLIFTAAFDEDGETLVIAAPVTDVEIAKRSLVKDFDVSKPPENLDRAESWLSRDGDLRIIFRDGWIFLGSAAETLELHRKLAENDNSRRAFPISDAPFLTVGKGLGTAVEMVNLMSELKADENDREFQLTWTTETRFDRNGMVRRTVSDFGLLGTIIAQFAKSSDTEELTK